MKALLLILFAFLCLASERNFLFAQTDPKLTYELPDKEKLSYSIEVNSKNLVVKEDVDFTPQRSGDSLAMDVLITKIEYNEPDLTADAQRYVDVPMEFVMDSRGMTLQPLTYKDKDMDLGATSMLNVGMFFPEFPDKMPDPGNEWKTVEAVEDILFDQVETRYTISKINEETYSIFTEMEFSASDEDYTKKLTGEYQIDKKTREVIEADFTISGFNGYSNYSGKMLIYQREQ